jgi:flagellar biosynthesis/type III secretory pathway protein FliH
LSDRDAFSPDGWIRPARVTPLRRRSALLRAARVAREVVLGPDGQPVAEADPLDGLGHGTPEEVAEAANIVAQARDRAEEILREASRNAMLIEADGHRDGLARGYAEGAAAARGELADALALVQRAAGEAKAMRDQLYARAERDLIELVIEATQSILGDRAGADALLAAETVRRALDRAGSQNVMRVRVHPDAAGAVEAWLLERHGEAPPFQVHGDHAIGVGGCIVDTDAGIVDARLDVQLDAIATLLREAVPPQEQATPGTYEEASDAA